MNRPPWCTPWCTTDHSNDQNTDVWRCSHVLGHVEDGGTGEKVAVELSLVRRKTTFREVWPGVEVLVGDVSFVPGEASHLVDLLLAATAEMLVRSPHD
ncbi:MAG TPA: hypothetical protein VFM54_15475 [Micromonosporaceae bacterium]|nr:hypothetical protein [Micromonosporaceae bacterium]